MDEKGYIKFDCEWIKSKPLPYKLLEELNNCRDELYKKGLIGMYENGIGFGNISVRAPKGFIITGSATGGIEKLTNKHYTLVTNFDFAKNSLTCKGPIKASSESLTHAAIYQIFPETNAIIHVHNYNLWERLINKIPTTKKEVEYGTPEMALEIFRLFKESDVKDKKIIAMAGHEEGIISFGSDLETAKETLLGYCKRK